jgi:hypothetical protein
LSFELFGVKVSPPPREEASAENEFGKQSDVVYTNKEAQRTRMLTKPMDSNYGERLIRSPFVFRKNYYGSGAEWSRRPAMMLFAILATLSLRKINPRIWLNWSFEACANSGGKAPANIAEFLPWNFSIHRLSELQNSTTGTSTADSW